MNNIRVLVVEDEVSAAEDVRGRLNEMGYPNCSIALNGSEAIQQARQCQPDIILMDIQLNGRHDGIDTAQHIRSELDIPVVYLTALSDDDTIDRMQKTQPFGYLIKPPNNVELRTTIELSLQHHRTQQELRKFSYWLTTTLHSIGDGMIVTDCQGQIQLINPVAQQMLGLDTGYYTDHPITHQVDIYNDSTGESCTQTIIQCIHKSKIMKLPDTAVLRRRDGKMIPVSGTVSPIQSKEKSCIGAILVMQDISRQRQNEIRIAQSQKEIELKNRDLQMMIEESRRLAIQANISNQFKSNFLADISQEIRHPVNTIAGFSCLLQDEIAEERLCEYLSIINHSCHELVDLLDNLSNYTRLETGQYELSIREYPLADLIANIDLSTRSLASRKGLQYQINCSGNLPESIHTDPIRLKQCLINLIDNAIKFTQDGYVHIEVSAASYQNQPAVQFAIIDSGIGIPAEHYALLLNRRPHPNATKTGSHSHGLGLAVTNHLVRSLQGHIDFQSQPGRGSRFLLIIPEILLLKNEVTCPV